MYNVERDQLAEVVDVNPDLLPGGRDPALRQAMDELLWIDTWERAQQVVERHAAVLLGPEADKSCAAACPRHRRRARRTTRR